MSEIMAVIRAADAGFCGHRGVMACLEVSAHAWLYHYAEVGVRHHVDRATNVMLWSDAWSALPDSEQVVEQILGLR